MKKNGFVSTTLIYGIFVVFLLIMIIVLNNYSNNNNFLQEYKDIAKNDIFMNDMNDLTIVYRVYNSTTNEYEIVDELNGSHTYNNRKSFCINGGVISENNKQISIDITGKDYCYIYFD